MKCPKCGAYNKQEYKKCYVCNALLPQEYIEEKHIENKKSMWNKEAFREDEERDFTSSDSGRVYERNIQPSQETPVKKKETNFLDLDKMDEDRELKKEYSIYAKREAAKERGVWGNEKTGRYTRRGEDNIPIIALEDEADKEALKKRKRGSKYAVEPLSKNASKIKYFREGQEIGVVVPPETEKPKEKKKIELPKKKTYKRKLTIKWGRLILVSLLAVAVIFGVIIGITALTGKVSESMSQLFVPRNQLPNNGQPLVERVLKDGQTWHTITFYGEDGDKILVEDESHNIKRTLTIHDNQAVLALDDYYYIPVEGEEYYGSEFTYVDIKAWHFDKDGTETELAVPEYRISVPLAPCVLIHPVEQEMTFDTMQVLVKIKVEPHSRVLIGTKNMSGNIDAEGYTSTYITLEDEGLNSIPVLVEVDGYRANNYEVLVYSPEKDVDIKLIEPPTETSASEKTIYGVTEPGATVTLDPSMPLLIDQINVDPSTGSFYIKTRFNDFGENKIILYVTTPDGRSATLKHIVYRIPLEGYYTGKAWVLDYKALSTSATKMIGQIYHLHGYFTERIDTSDAKLFLFNAGSPAEPRYLIVEYNGLYDIKLNDTIYDVYADVTGKYENYAKLYARFIYVSEDTTYEGEDQTTENSEVTDENNDNNE